MGVVLDSSVFVAAERQGQNARGTLAAIAASIGNVEISISVLTVMELAHGAVRANTTERRATRNQYLQELLIALPVHPITQTVAFRAGQLDGELQTRGVRVPLADLLIGVTALELGDGVGTANVRHFHLVPGLSVVRL
jgi:predicted nucleic acid-binding protein